MADTLSIESIRNQISSIVDEYGVSSQSIGKLAALLKQFAGDEDFWMNRYRPADKNEELLYEITIDKSSGIALYLVSDAPGVKSPPHIHHTWAIIAGISGVELNRLYTITNHEKMKVNEVKTVSVGSGEVITMAEHDIHSTEVVGGQSTYHLHLYGCDLKSLPAFSKRIFSVE
jgi:predicted metal-dependent enzyme (double-stranded beta helix superfamily)